MDGVYSDWSPVGIFATESETVTGEDPPAQEIIEKTQPVPVTEQQSENTYPVFPEWGFYLGLSLLAAIALLQITVLIMLVVAWMRR